MVITEKDLRKKFTDAKNRTKIYKTSNWFQIFEVTQMNIKLFTSLRDHSERSTLKKQKEEIFRTN